MLMLNIKNESFHFQRLYLLIVPLHSVSILLKRVRQKKDGSLHIFFVTDLKSGISKNKQIIQLGKK